MQGINFNKEPCIYWPQSSKISYLQRRVLVYSIMYYEYNESCVDDSWYDAIVKQLVTMQKANPKDVERSRYGYVFYDFEGSTGFYLLGRLNERDREYLCSLAIKVLTQWRREK